MNTRTAMNEIYDIAQELRLDHITAPEFYKEVNAVIERVAHVIETEEQHKDALAEADQLMKGDPVGDTPDGRRLRLLAVLIEEYERKHFPIGLDEMLEKLACENAKWNYRAEFGLEWWPDDEAKNLQGPWYDTPSEAAYAALKEQDEDRGDDQSA